MTTQNLLLAFVVMALAQSPNTSISGTVVDPAGAPVPGVTIIATNTQTGIATPTTSNQSGAYVFPALQPGTYQLRASLPGFQRRTSTVTLGSSPLRVDLALEVTQGGESSWELDDGGFPVSATTSTSVHHVLTEQLLARLPLVGDDVLKLVRTLPGVIPEDDQFPDATPYGVAGVGDASAHVTLNGVTITDGRYSMGIASPAIINPELVSEIRLVLAPADAEMGRGNGQVQIQTRSGTNRYTGSVVWNTRNSALNANTWTNNSNVNTAGRWDPAPKPWYNNQQYTLTFGGPLFRNRTFVFAFWNQQINYQRQEITANVMTDTARRGIFRYFERWIPGNTTTVTTTAAATATRASVDFAGNPITPTTNPDGTPYTLGLRCFSVFGSIKADGTPFTAADCPGGVALTRTTPWDPLRPTADSTGYIRNILNKMPVANYFGIGDGLNGAGYRWVRRRHGNHGPGVTVGVDPATDRKQSHIKLDHLLNNTHRMSVGWTYERNDTENDVPNWPGALAYVTKRYPQIVTANLSSTLSPRVLNEARFGLRRQDTRISAPWEMDASRDEAATYMIPGSNGHSALVSPGVGFYSFGGSLNGLMNITPEQYNGNNTSLYSYADSLSWTAGKHSMKFGGEIRDARSRAYNNQPLLPFPRIIGGAGGNTSTLTAANAALPNLLMASRTASANMLYFLAGSVNNATMVYWIDDPGDVSSGTWEDTLTKGRKFRDLRHREWNLFWKDDWNITRNLTLNVGLRYEYYGSPFVQSGITTTTGSQGDGLWGVSRSGLSNPFERLLTPGNVFLTGYGPNVPASSALKCAPPSCDPNALMTIEFVGPNSPNPAKRVIPADRNNFGPAVGFAWTLPWFGESKTVLRGGYQITYGGTYSVTGMATGGPVSLEGAIGNAPGSVSQAAVQQYLADFNGQYLDLRSIPQLIPVRPTNPAKPGRQFEIYNGTGDFYAFDPHYVTPYVQNFNLSVTRSLRRNLSLDVRYVGTVSKKQPSRINLNTPNVYHNKELFDALEITRSGGNSPLLDQMLAGLNLNNGVAGFGPIGTTVNGVPQTGSAHLRRNVNFAPHLANGNYAQVALLLNGNGSSLPTVGNVGGLLNLPAGLTDVNGRLLRNGCDRIAAGQTSVGSVTPRCFPENYIRANPQLANAFYSNNSASYNYHSMQAQVVLRPNSGLTWMSTYTWSKNLGVPGLTVYTIFSVPPDYTDPTNTRGDYTYTNLHRTHDFRNSGTFEFPAGPGRFLLGNSSGWVARLVEGWQTSAILTVYSGARMSVGTAYAFTAAGDPLSTGLYGSNVPDVVRRWPSVKTRDAKWVDGYSFYLPGPYLTVPDPQCANVTTAENLRASCTLTALASLDFTTGNAGDIVLQNPKPGTRGTLGQRAVELAGIWKFDASLSKTFKLSESGWIKSLQVRADAMNVLNHPDPGLPDLNINSGSPFGLIFYKGDQVRNFQGQVRLTF